MASYLELQVGRYNRLLQKLFGIKTPIRPTAVPEINQFLPLFHGVENRYLEGWDRFRFTGSVTGAAGVAPAFRFRNPSASNMVAVFELLTAGESSADSSFFIERGVPTADLTNINVFAAANAEDPRSGRGWALILSNQNATAPVGLTTIAQWSMGVNLTNILGFGFENQELALLPGSAIQLASSVAANLLTINAVWRERFLEDSERS